MKIWLWIGLVLVGIAGVSPFLLNAQIMSDPCCGTCQQAVVHCQCQRTRPVVQTQYRQEQVTTYRDVMETRYRQECVVEHTPVTTYEDRVETVWVPQQVTKKVAKTVMVPQAKARTVPYQVMQRIPQTATRIVPYQTVHHVTETVPMTYTLSQPTVVSQTYIGSPVASVPVGPAYYSPGPQTAINSRRAPPLSPQATHSDWQPIRARSSGSERFGDYDPAYDRSVPAPTENEPAVRKSSWRGQVPGAASAMNFHEQSVYR